MPTVYKDAQVQGTTSTSTYATLYNTTASTTAIISGIVVCNEAASPVTFRIGIQTSASGPTSGKWIAYDATVSANDSLIINVPISLGNTKYIMISSSANTCSFTASVAEMS